MKHFAAVLSCLALLLLGGCVPTLIDGDYTCTNDGECPPGWHCRATGRCHSRLLERFQPCGADEDCASGHCATGPDAMSTTGYCSSPCTQAADCEGLEREAECIGGSCLIDCGSNEVECPTGTDCFITMIPMANPPPRPACYAVVNPTFGGRTSCIGPPETNVCASPPAHCLSRTMGGAGVCVMRCEQIDDVSTECPMGTRCVEVFMNQRFCLARCPGMANECADGVRCDDVTWSGDNGDRLCIPTDWPTTLPMPDP